jgi:exopolysaccharide production protein ExoQ
MNSTLDKALLSVWILFASGAGSIFLLDPNAQGKAEGGGAGGIQAAYAVLYLVFAALLTVRFRESLALVVEEKWIFLLWLWTAISVVWSPVPGTTLRRTIALFGTTLAGLYMAMRLQPKQQVRLVAYCMGVSAILSLAVCLLAPHISAEPTGEWTGIFFQKNGLGRAMGLGLLCYTFLALEERRGRLVFIFMAIVCFGMLVMSRSMGTLLVCAITLSILPFRRFLILPTRKLILYGAAFSAVAIPVAYLALTNADAILVALGRDPSLTGRLPLWREVLLEISTRPWFGFGYSAFWYTAEGARIQTKLFWQMVHSHNGFLETTLGLGLVGLALLLIVLAKAILRGVRVARDGETLFDFWPLFFLIFAVLGNLAEVWFLAANSYLWMLLVANSYWLLKRQLSPVTVDEEDPEPSLDFASNQSMGILPPESGNFA